MGKREHYFSEHDALEADFERKIVGFKFAVIQYFRQNSSEISRNLNIVPKQARSFNPLLSSESGEAFCFFKTLLPLKPDGGSLSYGFRLNHERGTSAEMVINWSTATNQPVSFFLDGLCEGQRVGRLKFLVLEDNLGEIQEELVEIEDDVDSQGKSIKVQRHYLVLKPLYFMCKKYSVYGCNCAYRAFGGTIA